VIQFKGDLPKICNNCYGQISDIVVILRNVKDFKPKNPIYVSYPVRTKPMIKGSQGFPSALTTAELLVDNFFRLSAGHWRSERRYYTLPDGDTQEVISDIAIEFLTAGCPELQALAQLHGLDDLALTCGSKIEWDSKDSVTGKKASKGSTVFGALGNILYRDRGFATSKPITAIYHFPHPDTLCLKTEYQGSVFEEEVKLVGEKYRTRQTIISRAGEQVTIGQYLEKRIRV
jgi:CpeS-like protein